MAGITIETRIDTKMVVSKLFRDKIVSRLEMDRIRRGDTRIVRRYNEIINQTEYPERQIKQLMNEGKVDDAQRLYFGYINNQREGIIRL